MQFLVGEGLEALMLARLVLCSFRQMSKKIIIRQSRKETCMFICCIYSHYRECNVNEFDILDTSFWHFPYVLLLLFEVRVKL